jgi:hypothetical protein
VAPASLASRLVGLRDLAVARGAVGDRLARLGPEGFARELEPLVERAAQGVELERREMLAVASFVAHACARGEEARLLEVGAAAAALGLPFVGAVFAQAAARASLPARARLPEVGVAVFADISGLRTRRYPGESVEQWRAVRAWLQRAPASRRWMMRPLIERGAQHHDPIFIGRFLDQPWVRERDVVVVAARRPSLPAIALAVATRDRWFHYPAVREALAENPYTPAPLARALATAQ